MKRTLLFIILVIYLLTLNCYAERTMLTDKDKLQEKDFQVFGIKLNQPISEVIKILGEPINVKKSLNKNNTDFNYIVYSYPSLEIGFFDSFRTVIMIKIKREGIKTIRGISIGDLEVNVINSYGETKKWDNKLIYQLTTLSPDGTFDIVYSICFSIEQGKVKEIIINFAGD